VTVRLFAKAFAAWLVLLVAMTANGFFRGLVPGILWGVLTVAFEFGFGHYVSGLGWDVLLADYDVRAGRLWPLVLLATVAAPWFWGVALRGPAVPGKLEGEAAS
jgi:hypothetical protein